MFPSQTEDSRPAGFFIYPVLSCEFAIASSVLRFLHSHPEHFPRVKFGSCDPFSSDHRPVRQSIKRVLGCACPPQMSDVNTSQVPVSTTMRGVQSLMASGMVATMCQHYSMDVLSPPVECYYAVSSSCSPKWPNDTLIGSWRRSNQFGEKLHCVSSSCSAQWIAIMAASSPKVVEAKRVLMAIVVTTVYRTAKMLGSHLMTPLKSLVVRRPGEVRTRAAFAIVMGGI